LIHRAELPSSLNVPPPGKSAVTVTGNFELMETSEAVTLTWSYVLRFSEFVEPTMMLPSLSVQFRDGDVCGVRGPGRFFRMRLFWPLPPPHLAKK